MITIITASGMEWMASALKAYFEKKEFTFIDDMSFEFDKDDFRSAKRFISASNQKANINWIQIGQVLSSIGISATGIWLVKLAVKDSELYSRIVLSIIGGVIILTGSFGLLRSLGLRFSVSVDTIYGGFTIKPE